VALKAVVFDVGETLVDETKHWEHAADACGIPRFTLMALVGLRALRERGLRVGAAGNMRVAHEDLVRPHVDFVTSSERLGVEERSLEFFARVCALAECAAADAAYVGDRVDNDVRPALAAGMTAVHVRRGPWGHLHRTPPAAARIESLSQLLELV
jgi:FMN phosphatase YigB (HAD superfamily)